MKKKTTMILPWTIKMKVAPSPTKTTVFFVPRAPTNFRTLAWATNATRAPRRRQTMPLGQVLVVVALGPLGVVHWEVGC